MFSISSRGSFNNTEAYLNRLLKMDISGVLRANAEKGVQALRAGTPVESEVSGGGGKYTISWTNNDIEGGFPVAIMLQYGHGTGTGGYVQGIDYINPAMRPIFDEIATQVWKAVSSL
jgi:hypothetical protein